VDGGGEEIALSSSAQSQLWRLGMLSVSCGPAAYRNPTLCAPAPRHRFRSGFLAARCGRHAPMPPAATLPLHTLWLLAAIFSRGGPQIMRRMTLTGACLGCSISPSDAVLHWRSGFADLNRVEDATRIAYNCLRCN
jgi:hypothetical protein